MFLSPKRKHSFQQTWEMLHTNSSISYKTHFVVIVTWQKFPELLHLYLFISKKKNIPFNKFERCYIITVLYHTKRILYPGAIFTCLWCKINERIGFLKVSHGNSKEEKKKGWKEISITDLDGEGGWGQRRGVRAVLLLIHAHLGVKGGRAPLCSSYLQGHSCYSRLRLRLRLRLNLKLHLRHSCSALLWSSLTGRSLSDQEELEWRKLWSLNCCYC